jgi:hypothetical protein
LIKETDPKSSEIKKSSFLFPTGNEDAGLARENRKPAVEELYTEVQKKYTNFEPVKSDLEELF